MKTLTAVLFSAMAALVAGNLPALPDSIVVRDWLVAGPFPAGPREGITGVVEDAASFRPTPGETLWSALVQGGRLTWRAARADSAGWLETGYEGVRWDTIQDYLGIAGLYGAGYAWAEFESPRAGRALAKTSRLGGFHLNGRGYPADVYGDGWLEVPVLVDSGPNRVLLRLAGFGDSRVRFALVPPPGPVLLVTGDATLPDLEADSALAAWVGIPLVNTTERRLDSVLVRLCAGADTVDTVVNNLPGLGAKKVPIRLSFPAAAFDSAEPWLPVVVTVSAGGYARTDTLRAAVRRPGQPVRRTFRSGIDGSCQYYAVMKPSNQDPARRYPVIYTLHGAGVEAWGQANAYRQKDWAFVVAPTNRRRYGFDWQDWGRLDAVEVLDTVLARLPIDPDRVLLAGGSMGGHGAWHVGLTHPDRFAVVAPQASWPTHQLYVPWYLQRSAIFAQPGQLAVRDRVLRSDNVPAMLGNALNLPFFILHGGDDDNVPTFHGRNFAAWLNELGTEFVYREVPGRGHWWSDEELGTTVCDDTALIAYIRDRRRDAGPRRVRLRTADLGTANKAWWCEIERVIRVGQDAEIDARAGDASIAVRTTNVARFSLELTGQPFFAGRVGFEVDGRAVGRPVDLPGRFTFHRTARGWTVGPGRPDPAAKTPRRYGPCRQAMMRPFTLVYGTQDPALADDLRSAATAEATRWWLIANGLCEVLPDTAASPAALAGHNLVLLGGADANAVTRRLAGRLPIGARDGELFLGDRRLGPDLAAMFVYPDPDDPARLVLVRLGTDAEHTRLANFWGLVHSGAGIPDFIVFDRSVRRLGWGGVRAAGFFDPDWRFDPASSWLAE
ncbi:MAG: prolyl oligopeptidase family serine peptidase [bacterium]